MPETFADIDWSKPKAQLAADLEIVTSEDYVGYMAWSKRLGPPDTNSKRFIWSWSSNKPDAIDEVVCQIYDRYAPDEPVVPWGGLGI